MEVSCLPGVLAARVEDSRKGTFVVENTVGKEYFHFNALSYYVLLKNKQECSIISFKNSMQSREFLNLIIHDWEFFEWLQNLRYRSTHSCTNYI